MIIWNVAKVYLRQQLRVHDPTKIVGVNVLVATHVVKKIEKQNTSFPITKSEYRDLFYTNI